MKKSKFKTYKSVPIPHLAFEVHFMDMSQLQGIEKRGAGYTCQFEENSACVFIKDIEKSAKEIAYAPYFAHEIVHVLQILCEKRAMRIEDEVEHIAYLMHYLMRQVLDTPA